ncbi:MAG TPA: GxxExxY protein [Gemmatimonadaceae bacterium]|nr:GxxExxY protein [Gemmatimonadaceae bacterium]
MRQPDEMRARAHAASSIALDAGYYVHSLIGPGALEQTYQAFLAEEIRFRGLPVRTQVPIPVSHRGVKLDVAYRIDLLVDEALVIEVKAVVRPHPIHRAQLVSYLRLGGYRMGLLLNFHVERLKDGIRRVLNDW